MVGGFVRAALTDAYQVTMAYSHWQHGRAEEKSAFEVIFRRGPFGGSFAVFAGLSDFLELVGKFAFNYDDLAFLMKNYPEMDRSFFDWLRNVDTARVVIRSVKEGTVVFPMEPLVTVEGPLAVVQLLETALLNLTNFASLVCTNALRHRIVAGSEATLVEFGLRRAQGPDGAMTASFYSYAGGVDATSNVLASELYRIPLRGTHSHSYVQSYSEDDLMKVNGNIKAASGESRCLLASTLEHRRRLGWMETNQGELAAFISYAQAFPTGFLALVDTYNTLGSGILNFIMVGSALVDAGYSPVGVRIDSGDLAEMSILVREKLKAVAAEDPRYGKLATCTIMASDNINEETLLKMKERHHEIDSFGIGTNLVTCQAQPALGLVFKLVEINGRPRMKISGRKSTLPCKKSIIRMCNSSISKVLDLIVLCDQPLPRLGKESTFYSPTDLNKKIMFTPESLEPLLSVSYGGTGSGKSFETAEDMRSWLRTQLEGSVLLSKSISGSLEPHVAVSSELREVALHVMKQELGTEP